MSEPRERIAREAARAQAELAPQQVEQLLQYLGLLERWGARIRLTGREDAGAVIARHLPDALQLAALLPERGAVADIGAGAGLPGFLAALLRPQLEVTLVEPNQKRCSFLRAAMQATGRAVRLEGRRLEELSLPLQEVVWSRATFAPAEWLRRGGALVRAGGAVLVFVARAEALPGAAELPAGAVLECSVQYALEDGTPRLLARYRTAVLEG
ncbi:MAG: class I SAM-dependent methyltransferase [Deltaproteobacteria bacterium]|nr:class I SAM-dependent methyltransferase [Deltaproteobacteria bacterium]